VTISDSGNASSAGSGSADVTVGHTNYGYGRTTLFYSQTVRSLCQTSPTSPPPAPWRFSAQQVSSAPAAVEPDITLLSTPVP
jgi:hypothetical protein